MGRTSLRVVFTSDTHGHLLPVDYATGARLGAGVSAIARSAWEGPEASGVPRGDTLVIDGGDSLQGTPLMRRWMQRGALGTNPAARAFNALGVDVFTLGNHDFNFGRDILAGYLQDMDGQCVCANVTDARRELPIVPWVMRTLESGLVVGITGIVTDYVNVWERPGNLDGLVVGDTMEAARRVAHELAGACDVSICIYHGGFEEDLETGRRLSPTRENLACEMARGCGFDLLLTGHQHMAVPGVRIGSTWAVQPAANALHYVDVRGTWDDGAGMSWTSHLVPAGASVDGRVVRALSSLEEDVERWLDEPVGRLVEAIPCEGKLDVALSGSRVATLVNAAQLDATGADLSCTALPNGAVGLGEVVTQRAICVAYPFSNLLMVLSVSREALRGALERCASYLEFDESGSPRVSDLFLRPKEEHYNFDLYEGISAVADLSRPVGERIVSLALADGGPVPDVMRLACNDYRATGTGGYGMLGECPVVGTVAVEVPDLLARFLEGHSPWEPSRHRGLRFVW